MECDATELNTLQETCLSYGGNFSGQGASASAADCELSGEGNITGGAGNGECAINGEGSCTITCEFPEGVVQGGASGADSDSGNGEDSGGEITGGNDSGEGRPHFVGWPGMVSLADADHTITGTAGQQLSCPYSIAVADFDGDGLGDLAVSSVEDDLAGVVSGSVFLFRASSVLAAPTLSTKSADSVLLGEDEGDFAGQSLAVLRDFDGDGTPDLAIGAVFANSGAGRAYLFSGAELWGESSHVLANAEHRFESDDATSEFAGHLADAGDLDGDGLSDIIIGSIRHDTNSGAAWVFLSSDYTTRTSTAASQSRWRLSGESHGDYAGVRVGSLADLDGDMRPEMVVTAYLNESGGNYAGRAYIVNSSQLGDDRALEMSEAAFIVSGPAEGRLGLGLSTSGDMNGDGIFDLLLGAPDRSSSGATGGHAFVLAGTTVQAGGSITTSEAEWSVTGSSEADYLGYSVVTVPDLDGDGVDEVLTGAMRATFEHTEQGAAYLFLSTGRSTSETAEDASTTFWGVDESDQAGRSIATGDINGDGFADLVVGSCNSSAGGENAGAVYVLLAPVGTEEGRR